MPMYEQGPEQVDRQNRLVEKFHIFLEGISDDRDSVREFLADLSRRKEKLFIVLWALFWVEVVRSLIDLSSIAISVWRFK